jgi:hypothetical protein
MRASRCGMFTASRDSVYGDVVRGHKVPVEVAGIARGLDNDTVATVSLMYADYFAGGRLLCS